MVSESYDRFSLQVATFSCVYPMSSMRQRKRGGCVVMRLPPEIFSVIMSFWNVGLEESMYSSAWEMEHWREWGIKLRYPRLVFNFILQPLEMVGKWRDLRYEIEASEWGLEVQWGMVMKVLRTKHMGIWLQQWFERVGNPEYGDRGIAVGGANEWEGWEWNQGSLEKIEQEASEWKYPKDMIVAIQGDWVKLWFPQWE